MAIEIKAPTLPESVPDGTIATWHKKTGDAVKRDELLVDIETDKVVIEVVSPTDGVLSEILKASGDTIVSNELIARIEAGAVVSAVTKSPEADAISSQTTAEQESSEEQMLSPAAKKIAEENNVDIDQLKGSGKNGRVTKEDVLAYVERQGSQRQGSQKSAVIPEQQKATPGRLMEGAASGADLSSVRIEERVPMSRLRAKVAERLLQASQTTAMLTTFNEVDMAPVMELRNKYKDLFEKSHDGVRLGFMSFFVRASIEALKRFPAVNASIDGSDIVYHGYQDIGVAVSSPRGLVVPVLRNADHMGLAQIEAKIREYGLKAQNGKLSIDEMTGGTFTISNGGVFGSLLSTPILNPPQTAILGMHKIQERPMAVNGQVKILPMMYLALSYDHRMIDGKEAVQFLVTIKELLEDPARILLEI
jgi:2-oxoglutarate dehydrogenase E2 component (dihydrolipoamide succinyltransferase)